MVHTFAYTCCIGAAALYLLSRITGRDVEFLKSVTRVYQLKDLANLLETESTGLPPIIAVSGRVASETPIKCDHSGILGVIVEETAEQHFLKRNWKFSWVQDTALMLPVSKEVPWYLDDGTGRVNVSGAQGGIGFSLTVGSEVFEKSEPSSLIGGTLEYLRGLKMLGIRRIEHVLPIGTQLTVVGQTIKDGTDVRIQKPEQGPFYVSPIPLDQLISSLGESSRKFKNAAMGLALVGVILISIPVIDYMLVRTGDILEYMVVKTGDILERRRQRQLQKRVVDAAAKRKERVTEVLEKQRKNRSDGDAPDLCVICFERKYNAAFVECGHMCCCITCSRKFVGKACPLCREPVYQILKIYRS